MIDGRMSANGQAAWQHCCWLKGRAALPSAACMAALLEAEVSGKRAAWLRCWRLSKQGSIASIAAGITANIAAINWC